MKVFICLLALASVAHAGILLGSGGLGDYGHGHSYGHRYGHGSYSYVNHHALHAEPVIVKVIDGGHDYHHHVPIVHHTPIVHHAPIQHEIINHIDAGHALAPISPIVHHVPIQHEVINHIDAGHVVAPISYGWNSAPISHGWV